MRWTTRKIVPSSMNTHLKRAKAKPFAFSLFEDVFPEGHRYFSMVPVRVDFGTAPISVSSFCPPLKIITVGMLRMPYSVATLGLSSVLSFTWKSTETLASHYSDWKVSRFLSQENL